MKINSAFKQEVKRIINERKKLKARSNQIATEDEKEHLSFFNSNPTVEQFFTYLLPYLLNFNQHKTSSSIYLLSKYFTYFPEFYKIIKRQHQDKTNNILQSLAKSIIYKYYEHSSVLFQTGYSEEKFYIILNGSVDVVAPVQKQSTILIKEYFRYLAMLIAYNEKELLRKSLEDNYLTFPVEIIHENKDFQILEYIKNNQFRTEEDILINKKLIKIRMFDLFLYLSENEIEKVNEHGFVNIDIENQTITKGVNYLNNIYNCTSQDYVSIHKQYLLEKIDSENSVGHESKTIEVYVYEYQIINKLKRGHTFGEINTNIDSSMKTFTVITSNDCHVCYLERTHFINILRDSFERSRKLYLIFIVSTILFKNFSIKIMQNHFFYRFIVFRVRKGDFILKEGESLNRIMLFKEGTYDLDINISFKSLTNVIKYYLDKIKYSLNKEERIELCRESHKFLEEDKKIEYYSNQLEFLNKFFNFKRTFKLFNMNVPDLCGFKNMNYEHDYNLFNIKCISDFGEFLSVDWITFEQMGKYDKNILEQEGNFCLINNKKILKRLITIRQITLSTFFSQNKRLERLLNLQNKHYMNSIQKFSFLNPEEINKKRQEYFELLKRKSPPFQKQTMDNKKIILNSNEKEKTSMSFNRNNQNSLYYKTHNSHNFSEITKRQHSSPSESELSLNSPIKNFLVSAVNSKIKEKVQKWLKHNKNNLNPSNQDNSNINQIKNDDSNLYSKIFNNNNLFNSRIGKILKKEKRRNERGLIVPLLPSSKSSKNIISGIKKDELSHTMISSFETKNNLSLSFVPKEQFTIGEYQLKKSEKYLNERQKYLKESTRNVFLRNISVLKFTTRKKSTNLSQLTKQKNIQIN